MLDDNSEENLMANLISNRGVVLYSVAFLLCSGCGPLEDSYQKDADKKRIENQEYIASLVQEYKQKQGHYPHQKTDDAWRNDIQKYRVMGGSNEYKAFYIFDNIQPMKMPNHRQAFIDLLKEGLNKDIDIPADPQKYAYNCPRGFIYYSDGQGFKIMTFLGTEHERAVKRGNGCYEYTLTDRGKARVYNYSNQQELQEIMKKEERKNKEKSALNT